MKKFKRSFLKVCVIFAVLVALVFTFYDAITTDTLIAKFNNPPETEDYQLLKDYAMIYAKTLDKNSVDDSNVEITHQIQEDYITITVNELRCGIKATFPIEMISSESAGEFKVIISYQEVEYEEYSNLERIGDYIIAMILLFFVAASFSFICIYCPVIVIVSIIVWIIKKCNKKEKTT